MVKIKIESNPYKNRIRYYHSHQYVEVTKEECATSKLISKDYTECFFPFRVEQILLQIQKEYGDDNIEILFEGTSDEFEILCRAQQMNSNFKNIKILKGDKLLENGNNALNNIFSKISAIKDVVRDSGIDDDDIPNLEHYYHVPNFPIPICIFGSSNVGKATFINAIIGAEYLPNGPSKIFKITNSHKTNIANIRFSIDNKDFSKELNNIECLTHKVNKLLKTIDLQGTDQNTSNISDVIEIEVPFKSNIIDQENNPIVIFYIPDTNIFRNKNYFEILKEQLKDYPKGLPIFLTDFKGLISNSYKTLFEEFLSFEELDKRFTMIVVNKADEINNNEWSLIQETLKDEGLGVYFVSSLLGLGFKTDGLFLNQIDSDQYKKSVLLNTQRIYKYNLTNKYTAQQKQDLSNNIDSVYVNSGLFSIENALCIYASLYSAFSKCKKAHELFNVIQQYSKKIINDCKNRKEEIINQLQSKFDNTKHKIIEAIQNASNKIIKEFHSINDRKIKEGKIYHSLFSVDILKQKEEQILTELFGNKNVNTKQLKEEERKKLFEISFDKFYSLFETEYNKKENYIQNDSSNDCKRCSEKIRKTVLGIIYDSVPLPDMEKNSLIDDIIIEKYWFNKQQIKERIYKLKKKFTDSYRINIEKLANIFNKEYNYLIKIRNENTRNNHFRDLNNWVEQCLAKITEEQFLLRNNSLKGIQSEKKEQEKGKIKIDNNQEKLNQYQVEITKMISFE